jgi:hypothetical protein
MANNPTTIPGLQQSTNDPQPTTTDIPQPIDSDPRHKPQWPSRFDAFAKYAQDIFTRPNQISSLRAAVHLIPDFLTVLKRYLAEPFHHSSTAYLEELSAAIHLELFEQSRLEYLDWNLRSRGKTAAGEPDRWLAKEVHMIALYLAYRVEFGVTSAEYDHELMMWMASRSEKGTFLDLDTSRSSKFVGSSDLRVARALALDRPSGLPRPLGRPPGLGTSIVSRCQDVDAGRGPQGTN